jgi:hypothetical protein
MKVSGVFNGTGAAAYICLGFNPRKVRLQNIGGTGEFVIEWCAEMLRSHAVAHPEGWLYTNGAPAALAVGAGVRQYEGGDLLTSANQTSVGYGEGVFLGWDLADYRANTQYGASSGSINRWTLGSSSNRTGNWNVAKVASGARIGAGSRILIREDSSRLIKEAGISAITSDGEVANEVTLTRALGSGDITFISGLYDMAPIALGKVAPAGFLLSDTTLNVNDEAVMFEAED